MNYRLLLLLLFVFTSCRHERKIDTAFYYWKTVYKDNNTETNYIKSLHASALYTRIMDVDIDKVSGRLIPVSPIIFKVKLPDSVQIIPVVFIVNDALRNLTKIELDALAQHITSFVNGKVKQAGKTSYPELQIDCDWTVTTKNNYFYLLHKLLEHPALKGKALSATLRLHQLKNLKRNGILPVNKAMLMCYNMGNLRKHGNQNSILDIEEFKKYAHNNVTQYPLPLDVGFPLFNWAVVFRNKQYAGISRTIKLAQLQNKNQFIFIGDNRYRAIANLPQFYLLKNDEIRWEDTGINNINTLARYLSPLFKNDNLKLIYFHLDENIIKNYTPRQLQETADILR
ncbi:hypothetical protein [Mucilaginibacter terrae]|uniref:DUF4837 family protein n=1 Tax=Mucilaginibacter terrae TaxID=1955052 RepID=A0ABU3GQ99_9SPHI|nr:hypothetical protein [Mucilaginibacter terrae]MDT3401711.1 hypothetical protein [Mucilaginibacter terrae]